MILCLVKQTLIITAKDLKINATKSWIIGDKFSDYINGRKSGILLF